MAGTPAIRLTGLTKTFGAVHAVDGVDLDIAEGEFFSMLGPSGSGKTTVLRLIAGFEKPTAGTIELFGEDVTDKAPFDRDVNTVFQDYALFPHMSVLDNVAYGLRVRGVPGAKRRAIAEEALDSVRLAGFGSRRPSQLSGGQRQRVALARATVVQPKALLLDEPLGALDLKLREEMQVELKEIQRNLGITFIFVTHDQEEALTLSDRIAVFNDGKIVQLGTPSEIYESRSRRSSPTSSARRTCSTTRHPWRCSAAPDITRSARRRSPSATRSPARPATISVVGEIAEEIYVGTAHPGARGHRCRLAAQRARAERREPGPITTDEGSAWWPNGPTATWSPSPHLSQKTATPREEGKQ